MKTRISSRKPNWHKIRFVNDMGNQRNIYGSK